MINKNFFNIQRLSFAIPKAITFLLCICLFIISTGYSTDLFAADKNTNQKVKSKAPLIRKNIYDKLNKAQDLVQQQKYAEATKILDKIKRSRRLNRTESAQLWNFYALVFFSQDLYPQAIQAYNTLLEQPELQLGIRTSTLYTLSQLHFITEDYSQALARIQQWIALTEKPSPDAYALLGQAFYKLERYQQSIPALQQAIELQQASSRKAKENWYLLLRANHYELNDYKNMAAVLTELITLFPKPSYFRDLAGAYSQLGDTKKQLAIMEAMYEKGQLRNASQIKNLANLLLMHKAPYKAARILQKSINDGQLKRNEKNLVLLSQSWVQAREHQQAISPLTEVATQSDSADPWIKLGRAYFNLDQWSEAISSLQKGLSKKGIKRADSSYILLGMSYYNLKKLDKAKTAFTKAVKVDGNERNKKAARQWINYLETEIKREAVLSNL